MSTKCKNCSECCRDIILPPLINTNEDIERWLSYHKITIINEDGIKSMKIDIPCEHLKDNKCAIYEDRPEVCRQYYCKDYDNK